MIKCLLVSLILFLTTVPVYSQGVDTAWVRRYNGSGNSDDGARALAVDGAGNVYVTGYSYGSGTYNDYATIKYLPNGDTAWVRRYNGPGNYYDYAYAIALDGSGNVYVTGSSEGSGTGMDCATIKYLPNGDTAWVRRYRNSGSGGEWARALAVSSSGNVYVTGLSNGDYVIIKYLPNGDTAWVRWYGGMEPFSGGDTAYAIASDESGNVYVTGTSYHISTLGFDYATIKYLPNGDRAWVRRYDGSAWADDAARALAVDGSGNVYVTGYSYDSVTSYDYATIKYLPNGDTAWVRRYNGPGNGGDDAHAIALDGSGNVYVTGLSYGSGTGVDYCTIKYKPNGDTAWVRRYDGPINSYDYAHAIAVDDSCNVYVTGESYDEHAMYQPTYDYATIKYYPNGDTAWVRRYYGPQKLHNYAYAIASDESGNVYVTGRSYDSLLSSDYATIKYTLQITGVAGTVKDAGTQENLQDVLVEALQGGIVKGSDFTNIYGQYKIADLTPGTYDVRASKTGYITQIQTGKQISEGQATTVDFQLQLYSSVAGTVKYVYTQENLQDVLVEALQSGIVKGSDSTNIDGQYNIANLIPGTYDVRASKSGYVTQIQTGKQLFGGETTTVDFQLELPLEPLGDTALFFFAYSPVDLIVIDPNSDSIGIDFNTIANAAYDTTMDRNHDGDKDDIVIIPNPSVGDYLVRVVAELGADSGHYTLGIKMPRSSETIVITNREVPPPGQADTVVYIVMEYLRGDANRDGKKNVSDVIFLVNYLFKGGPPPNPLSLGDANCCKEGDGSCTVVRLSVSDVIYLINYLFKGGPAPCS